MTEMTRDDVIRSTAAHIRRVGELIVECTNGLNHRAVVHDASKWSSEEWPYFEEATPKLAGLTYGSPEYKESLRAIRPAIEHHNAVNAHHPEHHTNGIDDMSLLDLLEMLCDWKAAGERHTDGNIRRSLEVNRERFKIGPQLEQILLRTALQLGWIKE
jgi:hypothetical protein